MAHALKSKAVFGAGLNWSRTLDLAVALTANFGIWTLILTAPAVLRQIV